MLRIDKALTDHLDKRMYVDPGDEDFGQCFFNALRALFRLNRLAPSHRPVYTEGFTVYHHEAAPLPYHRVAAHGWVTQHDQVIDIDYVDCGRYEVAYFPGRHWPVEARGRGPKVRTAVRIGSGTPPSRSRPILHHVRGKIVRC